MNNILLLPLELWFVGFDGWAFDDWVFEGRVDGLIGLPNLLLPNGFSEIDSDLIVVGACVVVVVVVVVVVEVVVLVEAGRLLFDKLSKKNKVNKKLIRIIDLRWN